MYCNPQLPTLLGITSHKYYWRCITARHSLYLFLTLSLAPCLLPLYLCHPHVVHVLFCFSFPPRKENVFPPFFSLFSVVFHSSSMLSFQKSSLSSPKHCELLNISLLHLVKSPAPFCLFSFCCSSSYLSPNLITTCARIKCALLLIILLHVCWVLYSSGLYWGVLYIPTESTQYMLPIPTSN